MSPPSSVAAIRIAGLCLLLASLALPAAALPAGAANLPVWPVSTQIGPVGGTQVTSITAVSSTDAWAAARTCAAPCSPASLVVQRWTGKKWISVPAPKGLTSSTTSLGGAVVGASSATDAWVFAFLTQAASSRTDALHWTGRRWTQTRFPPFSEITSAAVFSSKDAWAFGTAGASAAPYDVHYNGKHWRTARLPGSPQALSAVSATDMWAIGPTMATARKPLAAQHLIAMHWTGANWQTLALPKVTVPAGDYIVTGSIAALGSDNVWETYALGHAGPCCFSFGGLEHWTGAKWHTVPVPYAVFRVTSTSQDGHGGIWLLAQPGGSTAARDFDHLSTSSFSWNMDVPPSFINATVIPAELAWIPRTRSLWAGGLIVRVTGTAGVILRG
jgi:hypothetical protein